MLVNRVAAEAKSRFLKHEGSASELKIATKRLEEKENNDFEEGRHRRHEKNMNIARRGPEKEVLKLKSFLLSFLEGGRGVRGFGRVRPGGSRQLRRQQKALDILIIFEKSRFLAERSSTFRDHRKSRSITAIR